MIRNINSNYSYQIRVVEYKYNICLLNVVKFNYEIAENGK